MFLDYDQDAKPSVFEEILRPRFSPKLENDSKKKAIQVEIHVALSPKQIKASILLNKLRLMGIFDLILELKSFVLDDLPEDDDDEGVYVYVTVCVEVLEEELFVDVN